MNPLALPPSAVEALLRLPPVGPALSPAPLAGEEAHPSPDRREAREAPSAAPRPAAPRVDVSPQARVMAAFEAAWSPPPAVHEAAAASESPPNAPAASSTTAAQPLALPAWLPQALASLRLAVDPEPHRRPGQAEPPAHARARFTLDTEPLGPLDVRIDLSGHDVRVAVSAARPPAADWLAKRRRDLAAALGSRGLHLVASVRG